MKINTCLDRFGGLTFSFFARTPHRRKTRKLFLELQITSFLFLNLSIHLKFIGKIAKLEKNKMPSRKKENPKNL